MLLLSAALPLSRPLARPDGTNAARPLQPVFEALVEPNVTTADANEHGHARGLDEVCDSLQAAGRVRVCMETANGIDELCPVVSESEYVLSRAAQGQEVGAESPALLNTVVAAGDFILAPGPTSGDFCKPPDTALELMRADGDSFFARVPAMLKDWTHSFNSTATAERPSARLRACVDAYISPVATIEELQSWSMGPNSDRCRAIITKAFIEVGARFDATSAAGTLQRDARNALLRTVTDEWGEPRVVGAMVLLLGCDPTESYDEFLSCTCAARSTHTLNQSGAARLHVLASPCRPRTGCPPPCA